MGKCRIYNVSIVILSIVLIWQYLLFLFGGLDMNSKEACEYLQINAETLHVYESIGLLKGEKNSNDSIEYEEYDLQYAAQFGFLIKTGAGSDLLKHLAALKNLKNNTYGEQVKILRKCRYELLEIIHEKQQILDRLDYMIYKLKEK